MLVKVPARKPGPVVHIHNPLHSGGGSRIIVELEASLGYRMRPCLKKTKTRKRRNILGQVIEYAKVGKERILSTRRYMVFGAANSVEEASGHCRKGQTFKSLK